jgi:TolB protein
MLDDGPDYSPDGQVLYFNSERTGLMKIWRMKPDGSEQQPVTSGEEWADWFAHRSPDGRWLVFLSFDKTCLPGRRTAGRLPSSATAS